MILRQLCVRQSRQLFALTRQPGMSSRFYSTETPVETAVQTPQTLDEFEDYPDGIKPPTLEEKRAALEMVSQRQKQKREFQRLGSSVTKVYDPEIILRHPPKSSSITLEFLLASQTHLGHSTSRWNPQNSRYIFGIRDGIHIISLDATAAYLRRAATVVEEVAARGGLILFAGSREGQKRAVVRAAQLAKGYHIFQRWIPGGFTNGQQILGHCRMKVVNAMDEDMPYYGPLLQDHASLKPDLVVCLNPIENEVLLHECGLNNIPTIGVIDTDADPTRVTYPIPANDDSVRATSVIAGVLGRAGQDGQKRRMAKAAAGQFTYEPIDIKAHGLDRKPPPQQDPQENLPEIR